MTYTNSGGVVTVDANLTNAYSGNRSSILSWTRNLVFAGNKLTVHDVCTVAAGVKPIFQLQVPAQPVAQMDGSIVAGHLRIVPLMAVTPTFTANPGPEFSTSYRIDLAIASGCEFNIELWAQ